MVDKNVQGVPKQNDFLKELENLINKLDSTYGDVNTPKPTPNPEPEPEPQKKTKE